MSRLTLTGAAYLFYASEEMQRSHRLSLEWLRRDMLPPVPLRGTRLSDADLRETQLQYTNLQGADLRGAVLLDITFTALTRALYDERTRWPDGFDPRAWDMIYMKWGPTGWAEGLWRATGRSGVELHAVIIWPVVEAEVKRHRVVEVAHYDLVPAAAPCLLDGVPH